MDSMGVGCLRRCFDSAEFPLSVFFSSAKDGFDPQENTRYRNEQSSKSIVVVTATSVRVVQMLPAITSFEEHLCFGSITSCSENSLECELR